MNGLIAEQHTKYVPSDEQSSDYEQFMEAVQKGLELQAKELGFEIQTHRKTGEPMEWMRGFSTETFRSVGSAKRSLRHLGKDCATRDQSIIGFVSEEGAGSNYKACITFYWVSVERI